MQNYRLGDYIRQRRQELNLTQEQVCAGICEPVTLSRFENGRQTPSRTSIYYTRRYGQPVFTVIRCRHRKTHGLT